MRIKRTHKEESTKAGQVEFIDEKKAREIFNNTVTYDTTACPYGEIKIAAHGSGAPIQELKNGRVVETFFSRFELAKPTVAA